LGYWLSEDSGGVLPELYNDRIVYLGGIDFMIPGTSAFLSAQVVGAYVLDFPDDGETDVDRLSSYDGTANSIMAIGSLDLPFGNDTMSLRLSGLCSIQGEGYLILPEYRWDIKDDFEFCLSGQIFAGSNTGSSPYYYWDSNDNVSASITYIF